MEREVKGSRTTSEPSLPKGSKVIIAASVPAYLGLAWLIANLLPDYSFIALVPVAFGIHSATVLLFRGRQ